MQKEGTHIEGMHVHVEGMHALYMHMHTLYMHTRGVEELEGVCGLEGVRSMRAEALPWRTDRLTRRLAGREEV